MVLYNTLESNHVKRQLADCEQLAGISEHLLLNITEENGTEFSLWSVNRILAIKDYLRKAYHQLSPTARLEPN